MRNPKLIPVKRNHLMALLVLLAVLFSGTLLFENWTENQNEKRVLGVDTE